MKTYSILVTILLFIPFSTAAAQEDIEQPCKTLIESSREVAEKNLRLNRMHDKQTEKWNAGRVAFIELVMLGEPGWKALTDLCLDLSWEGDAARSMDTLVPISGKTAAEDILISKKLLEFQKFKDLAHAEKAKNETWALLYANSESRFLIDDENAVYSTSSESFRERLDLCCGNFNQVTDALVPLSHLRIYFRNNPKFPGHDHPWNGTEESQIASLLKIQKWCIDFRKSLPEPIPRPN